jgi:protein ImuB
MPEELRESLAMLGLVRCADLGRLTAGEVELRFGAEGLSAWRLARGDDPRWPFRPAPPERPRAGVELEAPVETTEPLRFLLPGLVGAVVEALSRRQRIPASLRLLLHLADGATVARGARPARPTAEERVLVELCRAALEAAPLPAPLTGLELEGEEGAGSADQLDVFRPAAPDPGSVHTALLPLLARWGEEGLSRAAARGAHLPEERVVWEARGERGIPELARRLEPAPPRPVRPHLPLCLRRHAEPLPVTVEVDAAGRPRLLRLPDSALRLRAEGPERLSGRWWAGGYAREYWLCEGEDGCLRLLYRDGLGGEWREEGWYD